MITYTLISKKLSIKSMTHEVISNDSTFGNFTILYALKLLYNRESKHFLFIFEI